MKKFQFLSPCSVVRYGRGSSRSATPTTRCSASRGSLCVRNWTASNSRRPTSSILWHPSLCRAPSKQSPTSACRPPLVFISNPCTILPIRGERHRVIPTYTCDRHPLCRLVTNGYPAGIARSNPLLVRRVALRLRWARPTISSDI